VSDQNQSVAASDVVPEGQGFSWHPKYSGKTFERVRKDLAEEIARDQRSYKLAMDGADQAEHDSLSTIVELERRWSTYEFDWAGSDPDALAQRILNFEKACEREKKEISFAEYRASGALLETEAPREAAPARSLPIMQIGLAILVVLLIIFAFAIFM
jgi:hypothetical protein